MNLQKIYIQAKHIGLSRQCNERMTADLSVKNLCEMYFDEDNWAISNNFPSLSVLREYIGKSEAYGIYTDFKGSVSNTHQAAFFGESAVNMDYCLFSVGNIIVRHNSKVNIKASGNSILFITALDNSELNIECTGKASVTVFNKSSNKITSHGNVIIKQWPEK